MSQITTEIEIHAPIDAVWNTLTEFDEYPTWNSIMEILGHASAGEEIELTLDYPNQSKTSLTPTIKSVESPHDLRWTGHLLIPGLFDVEHYFELEDIDGSSTKVVQGENFSGILKRLVLYMMGDDIKAGFELMNAELKAHVESMVHQE